MANFETHFKVATLASAIISSTLLTTHTIEPNHAVLAFGFGILGGILPDIDSSNSKPITIAFNLISLFLAIIAVFIKADVYSVAEMIIMAGGIFMIIRYGLIEIFRKFVTHRGMFHSIPTATLWGVIVAIIMHYLFDYDELVSWIYGLMTTLGYIVHLTLDEFYSVDLYNRRMKKSFGTALKFFMLDKPQDKLYTISIYLALFMLISIAPDYHFFVDSIFSDEALKNFQTVLVPSDGKWFSK
ncbi:MAG: metal-dependent hydrolase [Epsilonproteobacteria bacterium]|nr:metal-dependent hydrolase [Campylobacterota bacterium]MBD3839757.1 metal-dependent hydrolase [Campylobacterota bacterium]